MSILLSLHRGDNVKCLQSFVLDNSVDLTVTSPPYDNLRNYTGYTWDFDALAQELWRVTKQGGIIMWNVQDSTIKGSKTLTSFKQAIKFQEIGFRIHDVMIYEKGNFSNPSSTRYHQIWEFMFILSKGSPKAFNPIKDKKIVGMENPDHARLGTFGKNTVRQKDGSMKDRGQRRVYNEYGMRTNIWRMLTAGQQRPGKAVDHPAKMPYAMAHDHIVSWSNPGDVILDPFAGSGTTGIAALELGRKFIGIEISEEYFEICKKNCEDKEALAGLISP